MTHAIHFDLEFLLLFLPGYASQINISCLLFFDYIAFIMQRERFHDVHDEQGWEASLCPAGLHRNGTCLCEPSSVAEESSSHANISQIILLTDALFEVNRFLLR